MIWIWIHSYILGSVHEGTDFILAFGKAQEPNNAIELIITSNFNTSVTIELPSQVTEIVNVAQNVKTVYQVAGNMRVTGGTENKAFYVKSDKDIRILVPNFYKGGDAYLAFPYSSEDRGNFTFIAASHVPDPDNSNYGESFAIIASNSDDTGVTIYRPQPSGGFEIQEVVTLSRLQTKLVDSDQNDITGALITADKPISVVSGMQYGRINDISGPDSFYIAAPPLTFLSREHIVPPIEGRDTNTGYFVRVISAEDNNTINIFNNTANIWMDPVVKPSGQLVEINVDITYSALCINCSKPCLVVQYNKGAGAGSGSDPFMMWIPSLDLYTQRNTTFYTLRNLQPSSNNFNNFVSLLALNADTQNMLYDGNGISTWGIVTPWNEYKFSGFSITEGEHEIGSVSGTKYLVWIYGHKSYRAYGYLATTGGKFN